MAITGTVIGHGVISVGVDKSGYTSAIVGMEAESRSRFGRIGKFMQSAVGIGAIGAVAAIGLIGKKAVGLEAEFSRTMNKVQAATGTPQKGMKALSDLAIKMGRDTVFSANDAAAAMLELAKGGMNKATIEGGALKASLTLAAAGGLDMATSANTMVRAMGAFGLTGKQAGQVAAALAGAANASSADINDLSFALSASGLAAHSAGFSIQETTAILAGFANQGLMGQDAGTSLKVMLQRLQPETKRQSAAFKELGLLTADGTSKFVNANGTFKSAAEIAGILQKGTEGLTQAQKTQYLGMAFGTDAMRGAMAMSNMGAEGIRKYTKATSDQAAAQNMANAGMKGTAGAIEQLKGSIETVLLQLGMLIAPVIQAGLKFLTIAFNALGSTIDALSGGVPWLSAAFQVLMKVVGTGVAIWGAYRGAILLAHGAQLLWSAATSAGAAVMGVVRGAITAWTTAQWLLNVAMTANPIGVVIVAIAALVAAVVLIGAKMGWLDNVIGAVWNAMKATWNAGFAALKATASAVWTAIQAVFSTSLNVIKNVVTSVWNAIKSVWQASFNVIHTVTSTVWNVIKAIWTAEFNAIRAIVTTVWNTIKSVWSAAFGVIRSVATAVWAVIKGIFQREFEGIRVIVNTIWNLIKAIWNAAFTVIKTAATNSWNAIRTTFSTIFNAIKAIVTTIWDAIKTIWNAAFGAIRTTASNVWGAIRTIFSNAFGAIRDTIRNIWEGIKTIWSNAIGWVRDTTHRIMNALGDFFHTWRERIGTIFGNLVDAIHGAWLKLKAFFANPINWVIRNVINHVIGFVVRVAGALGMKLSIAPVHEIALAEGGVLPGFTPGRDVHNFYSPTAGTLALSGGEGILRPEAVQGMGVRRFNALNAAARSGGAGAVRNMLHFALGGMYLPVGMALGGHEDRGADWNRVKAGGGLGAWDFPVGNGTPVHAAYPGKVGGVYNLGNTSFGRYVRLVHAQGMYSLYAHLRDATVAAGQAVKAGQIIAHSDNTGGSTGPHLHFEVGGGTGPSGGLKLPPLINPLSMLMGLMGGLPSLMGMGGGDWIKSIGTGAVNKIKDAATGWAGRQVAATFGTGDASVSAQVNRYHQIASNMLAAFGWSRTQLMPLIALWNSESGWDPHIVNKKSGAYGIPQALPASKMASAGADWRDNPATQIKWGLGYIKSVYGSPAAAWAFKQRNNWYDQGGMAMGSGMFMKRTSKPERILSPRQTEAFEQFVSAATRANGADVMASHGGTMQELVITNWEQGKGYIRSLAVDEYGAEVGFAYARGRV